MITSPEPYIDAAVASLRQHINTQIDLINVTTADFDLPPIKDERILFGGDDVDPIVEFPTIEVAVPDETIGRPSLMSVEWDLDSPIIVKCHMQNTREIRGFQALYRACLRMRLALLATLMVPDAFGAGALVANARVYHQVNPLTGQKAQFIAAVTAQFTLELVEVQF